jgi:hypothetical protein
MSDQPAHPHPATTACAKCGKPMVMVVNLDTGKDGPADTRTVVYVVRRNADRDGKPLAMTAKKFLERMDFVVMNEGGEQVTYTRDDFLGMFVSHFNTCPHAAEFSQKGRPKR